MPVIFRIFTMVPMMVLWRCKNILDETEVNPGIGMNQYGVNGDKNDVNIEYRGRKSEYIQWDERHGPCKKYINKVRATAS